jgi:hypothetical protein
MKSLFAEKQRRASGFGLVFALLWAGCGTITPPLLTDDGSVGDHDARPDVDASVPSKDAPIDTSKVDTSMIDQGSDTSMVTSDVVDLSDASDHAVDGPADRPDTAVPDCTNGATRLCKDDPVRPALLGNCAAGTETCAGGHWGPCSVQPAAKDSCVNGDDATCDGTPNKDCPCINGATQDCGPPVEVGICKRGKQTCVGSAWGMCSATFAAARDCTSATDNDCDGKLDNTIDTVCQCAPNAMQTCGAHPGQDLKGPCKAGSQTCVVAADKKTSAWGACNGSVGPAANDTCDLGNDANCSGTPNDGCQCINTKTQSCPACGTQTCAGGAWGMCQTPAFGIGELKWPMPNAPSAGLANPQSYDTSQSGRVIDRVTGLTWQAAFGGLFPQGMAASYCTGLVLGGQMGWRLPSVIELASIADDTKASFNSTNSTYTPAIDQAVFPNTPSEAFWTATPVEGGSLQYWTVSFSDGGTSPTDSTTTAWARCVK